MVGWFIGVRENKCRDNNVQPWGRLAIKSSSKKLSKVVFFSFRTFVSRQKYGREKKEIGILLFFSRYLFPRRPIILNIIIIFIRACRLRRRFSAPSLRPQAVLPQSCKKSFLRSLFCSSGTSAYVLAGFPPTTSRGGWWETLCRIVFAVNLYRLGN